MESVHPLFEDSFSEFVRDFFYARESAVGIEFLMDQLIEHDLQINSKQFLAIERAVEITGAEGGRLEYLRTHCVSTS